MKSFSERMGIKPVADVIQVGTMNDELRATLWNVLDEQLWSTRDFVYSSLTDEPGYIEVYSGSLWFNYFKRPLDERPGSYYPPRGIQILSSIREYFFSCSWNEVYDFIEFTVQCYPDDSDLIERLNEVLQRELAGYRIINGCVTPIIDEQEKTMLEEAIADTSLSSVSQHLERALRLLADRANPDYRNSIKESISAVEAMAREVSGRPKATLHDALKVIEKSGKLHPALKDGLTKLYAYTGDEHGVRHAMMEEPHITQADAKFFLLACTSFVNYLKTFI